MPVLRIIYKKEGKAIFISTNYIGKIFERAIRRLPIPLIFSRGYTRRIKMSLGPSLAVGITGTNEVVDIHIANTDVSVSYIKDRLNKFLPEGLSVVECRYLKQDEKSPPEIKNAFYTVKIPGGVIPVVPENWKIVSQKDDIIDIIISFNRFKHKDLFLCFGTENIIKRVLIF